MRCEREQERRRETELGGGLFVLILFDGKHHFRVGGERNQSSPTNISKHNMAPPLLLLLLPPCSASLWSLTSLKIPQKTHWKTKILSSRIGGERKIFDERGLQQIGLIRPVCDPTSPPASSFFNFMPLVVSPVSYRLAQCTQPRLLVLLEPSRWHRSGRRPRQLFHRRLKWPFDVLRRDGSHSARGRRLYSLTVTRATGRVKGKLQMKRQRDAECTCYLCPTAAETKNRHPAGPVVAKPQVSKENFDNNKMSNLAQSEQAKNKNSSRTDCIQTRTRSEGNFNIEVTLFAQRRC